MHGPHFAKEYINTYLKAELPKRLVRYRNGWGISNAELPDPEDYFVHEPLVLDHWPTIITLVISTNSFDQIGWDSVHPLYRVNYSMRTYVWSRTEGSEDTTRMRDRLTVVVRSALLDSLHMNAEDDRKTFRAEIDQTSIREEFSDLTLLKGDRVLAGAYISYNATIDEIVHREDIAEVSEIEVGYKANNPIGVAVQLPADNTTSKIVVERPPA
jgi:hypothetical protein